MKEKYPITAAQLPPWRGFVSPPWAAWSRHAAPFSRCWSVRRRRAPEADPTRAADPQTDAAALSSKRQYCTVRIGTFAYIIILNHKNLRLLYCFSHRILVFFFDFLLLYYLCLVRCFTYKIFVHFFDFLLESVPACTVYISTSFDLGWYRRIFSLYLPQIKNSAYLIESLLFEATLLAPLSTVLSLVRLQEYHLHTLLWLLLCKCAMCMRDVILSTDLDSEPLPEGV